MSTPSSALVQTDWLDDPIADQVGPAAVALMLQLAARAILEAPGRALASIAPATWFAYFDEPTTARAVEAGLVDPIPDNAGRVLRFAVGAWLLANVATDQAIARRVRTRERVRRLRWRQAQDSGQLNLRTAEEGESLPLFEINKLRGRLILCKNCGSPSSVTADVTLLAAEKGDGDLYPRARGTYVERSKAVKSTKAAKSGAEERAANGGDEPPAFRLLLALVGQTRRSRWSWRYPTSPLERRELLDAIRTRMASAHLTPVSPTAIRRAVRIDECNDVSWRAAAGQIGGSR